MTDEQVDEDVTEEVAIIEELDPTPVEKSGFGLGSIADGADDPVIDEPIDDWLQNISFDSTADVPIPDSLVDRVIGQEDAAVVIRKAAEQRRHMLMIGDPGTGKSMLAKAMTELMPSESLEDTLCYINDDDENEPRIRTVPAGRGDRIVKDRRA
ncbi:MAG: ATP-binding protein, partial [Candidatus Thalassarchaeaceae archaeon]|nr:ATP-binding protein [Candidatus Thalassarchaeaceae archaeon]